MTKNPKAALPVYLKFGSLEKKKKKNQVNEGQLRPKSLATRVLEDTCPPLEELSELSIRAGDAASDTPVTVVELDNSGSKERTGTEAGAEDSVASTSISQVQNLYPTPLSPRRRSNKAS